MTTNKTNTMPHFFIFFPICRHDKLLPVSSIIYVDENFSHLAFRKVKPKMVEIEGAMGRQT